MIDTAFLCRILLLIIILIMGDILIPEIYYKLKRLYYFIIYKAVDIIKYIVFIFKYPAQYKMFNRNRIIFVENNVKFAMKNNFYFSLVIWINFIILLLFLYNVLVSVLVGLWIEVAFFILIAYAWNLIIKTADIDISIIVISICLCMILSVFIKSLSVSNFWVKLIDNLCILSIGSSIFFYPYVERKNIFFLILCLLIFIFEVWFLIDVFQPCDMNFEKFQNFLASNLFSVIASVVVSRYFMLYDK